MMRNLIACLITVLPLMLAAMGQPAQTQPSTLFTQLGLTPQQRAAIDEGRPAAKVLAWGTPSEVYVFGAVYIDGAPDAYVRAVRNVAQLAGSPGYLGIGELPAAATSADLRTLTLEADDIKALRSCREGACDVQLPTESIQAFHDAVGWSKPDVAAQVNELARGMVIDLMREYRQGGNAALGVYRDKQNPARVAEQFATMVGRSATLPDVLPALRQYLLNYPKVDLPAADSFFYWEKVDFGLKPTIRVNHAVIYHSSDLGGMAAVAIKQLYASHYFHTALDVSVCARDTTRPERHGFYLMTLKGSEQEGLTGVRGSVLRKVIVDKTRSSLERALVAIKQTVEQSARASNN